MSTADATADADVADKRQRLLGRDVIRAVANTIAFPVTAITRLLTCRNDGNGGEAHRANTGNTAAQRKRENEDAECGQADCTQNERSHRLDDDKPSRSVINS